jgi:hypothetical protein
MKKHIAVFLGFSLLFCATFAYLQAVYVKKGVNSAALVGFYNEPENSLDVIAIGPSTLRSAVKSAVLWDEAGIATYNMSMTMLHPIASYYLLCEVLRYQTPSVVLLNGMSLFAEADTDRYEPWLRRSFDHMRMSGNKLSAINAIVADSEKQTHIDYLLPLLRFHGRDDLTEADFDFSYLSERSIQMGSWGGYESNCNAQTRPESFNDPGIMDVFELHSEYLEMSIEKCKEYGIGVVIVAAPTMRDGRWSLAKGEALRVFAEEHGVRLMDFNTLEMLEAAGIDPETDFYDSNHVNLSGGQKISTYIAQSLSVEYELPDRRASEYDPHWDEVVAFVRERVDVLRDVWEGGGNADTSDDASFVIDD